MEIDRDAMLKKIVFLEMSGVGCGPDCACRAALATTLSDPQSDIVAGIAKGVLFDKQEPVGEVGVLEALGSSATALQTQTLNKIAADKQSPKHAALKDVKGWLAEADLTLSVFENFQVDPFMVMLNEIFGGERDIANMGDDDIRAAAYRR